MAKASELYRPDGRPARQYGEELIAPGEPYSEETLGTIRALISDPSPTSPLPLTLVETPDAADLPDAGPAVKDPEPPEPAELPNPKVNLAQPALAVKSRLGARLWPGLAAEHDSSAPSTERLAPLKNPRLGWSSPRLFRAAPRIVALVLLAAVALWRPDLVLTVPAIVLIALILALLLAGNDRTGSVIGWALEHLKRRNPQRAARLVAWANRLFLRYPRMADLLPLSWVQPFDPGDTVASIADATVDASVDLVVAERLTRLGTADTGSASCSNGS